MFLLIGFEGSLASLPLWLRFWFALGPGPVLLLFCLVLFAWDDTQIWLGDLHFVWLGVVFVF